jgi:hypothetical protein
VRIRWTYNVVVLERLGVLFHLVHVHHHLLDLVCEEEAKRRTWGAEAEAARQASGEGRTALKLVCLTPVDERDVAPLGRLDQLAHQFLHARCSESIAEQQRWRELSRSINIHLQNRWRNGRRLARMCKEFVPCL